MSGNTLWSIKVDTKLSFELVIFSIFSSDIPSDFPDSIQVPPLDYLVSLLAGINNK